ncbi:MAG TPA: hypothetical protein VJY15_22000 [Candidatus Acidoferrum sp.]|nr:hypothetical protein [Candidatus Acidoferrum sp.]
MKDDPLVEEHVAHRNFNLCPHCIHLGEPGLLSRLCESMPMISRSDGKTFHVVLADRPLAYPQERQSHAPGGVSVCFWYCHIATGSTTHALVVILPQARLDQPVLFRVIDSVADLLAAELLRTDHLASLYQFSGNALQPLPH